MNGLKLFLIFLFASTVLIVLVCAVVGLSKKQKPKRAKPLKEPAQKNLQESIRLNEENRKFYFAEGIIKQQDSRLQRIYELNNYFSISDLQFKKDCTSRKEFETFDPDGYIISLYMAKAGELYEACQNVEWNRANINMYYSVFDRIASEECTIIVDGFSVTKEECMRIANKLIAKEKRMPKTNIQIRLWIVYSSSQGTINEKRYKDYNYESIHALVMPYLKQEQQQNWVSKYYQSLNEDEEEFVRVHLSIEPDTELLRVDKMTGVQFEKWCRNLFSLAGYSDIKLTKSSGDYGADLICFQGEEKVVVQCKCFQSVLGLKPIQEVIGAIGYYKASIGIVVTNNYFTHNAKLLASETGVKLFDREILKTMLKAIQE